MQTADDSKRQQARFCSITITDTLLLTMHLHSSFVSNDKKVYPLANNQIKIHT